MTQRLSEEELSNLETEYEDPCLVDLPVLHVKMLLREIRELQRERDELKSEMCASLIGQEHRLGTLLEIAQRERDRWKSRHARLREICRDLPTTLRQSVELLGDYLNEGDGECEVVLELAEELEKTLQADDEAEKEMGK